MAESVNFACRPENYNQRPLDIRELDILAKVLDWPEDYVFPGYCLLFSGNFNCCCCFIH